MEVDEAVCASFGVPARHWGAASGGAAAAPQGSFGRGPAAGGGAAASPAVPGPVCGWRRVIGNVYVEEATGRRHVCDFNCEFRRFDPARGFFACAVSGAPSRALAVPKRAADDMSADTAGAHDAARAGKRRYRG